jgi:hypothetical protein
VYINVHNVPAACQLVGPGGFNTGIKLWLRAADIAASDGDPVHSWVSVSDASIIATSAGMGSAPTFRSADPASVNFYPAVSFNGISNGLNLGANCIYSNDKAINIFVVNRASASAIGKTEPLMIDQGFVADYGYGISMGPSNTGALYAVNQGFRDAGIPAGEEPLLLAAEFNFDKGSMSLSNMASLVNSVTFTAASLAPPVVYCNSNSGGPFTIGRQSKGAMLNNNNGRFYTGEIAEIIVYEGEIGLVESLRIQTYLAIKYGITLQGDYYSSGGDIIWDFASFYPSGNAVGIGRDDASGLNHLMSKSSMGNETILLRNGTLGAPEPFIADNTYIILGHNNLSRNFTRSLPGGSIAMERSWRASLTGSPGPFRISLTENHTFPCGAPSVFISSDNFASIKEIVTMQNYGATALQQTAFWHLPQARYLLPPQTETAAALPVLIFLR